MSLWIEVVLLIVLSCYLAHCIRTDIKLHRLMDEVEKKLKEEDQNED